MHTSDDWYRTIDRLQSDLGRTARAIEATTSDPRLNQLNHEKAVASGYKLMAYENAAPVLDDLRTELVRAEASNENAISDSEQATAQWTRTAIGTGLVAGLLLLINLNFSVPWWLIGLDVLLIVACVLSVLSAIHNYTKQFDESTANGLARRILAIESACERCTTADGLAEVEIHLGTKVAETSPVSLRVVKDSNAGL